MDDLTIRTLLSRFIKQLLINNSRGDFKTFIQGEEELNEKRDLFADDVALAAWNSLIYLLRQSFVKAKRVNLPEVGEFVKQERDGSWGFFPAASLAQADAVGLAPHEESEYVAKLALFHLNQGMELARLVNADMEIRTPTSADLLDVYGDLLQAEQVQLFSRELSLIAQSLEEFASRFEPEASSAAPEPSTQKGIVRDYARSVIERLGSVGGDVKAEEKRSSYTTREGSTE